MFRNKNVEEREPLLREDKVVKHYDGRQDEQEVNAGSIYGNSFALFGKHHDPFAFRIGFGSLPGILSTPTFILHDKHDIELQDIDNKKKR